MIIAVAVGGPDRILIGARDLPGNFIAACRLLRADRRPGAKLTATTAAPPNFSAGPDPPLLSKIIIVSDLGQAGRSIRLDHQRSNYRIDGLRGQTGITRHIGGSGGEAMGAIRQRRRRVCPGPGGIGGGAAQKRRPVIDLDRAVGFRRAGEHHLIRIDGRVSRDDGRNRRRGVHGRRHRRGGGGIAGRVDGLGGQAVRAVRQPQGGEVPVATNNRRRAQVGRAVKHMHRRHAIGVAHRAGQRQRIVLGQSAARDRRGRAGIGANRRADRLARRRGVERDHVRRRGRSMARRIGELGRNLLAAVGPEVAGGHRKDDAGRRHLGRGNGVRHVCASAEPPSSSWTTSPTATVELSATVNVGLVTLVRLSLCELPESDATVRAGVPPVGAVVSKVKVMAELPVLPAASVSLATMVCVPSARPSA